MLQQLLSDAWWYEDTEFSNYPEALRFALNQVQERGAADRDFAYDILRREALCGFVVEQGIVFLSSALPAARTQLCFVAFRHRIIVKKCKVRAVAVGCFRPEDRSLLFHCQYLLHRRNRSVETFSNIRTREELTRLLEGRVE